MNNPIFQAALHPCIAIVAPGGYAPDAVGLESGIARLEALGCEVRNYYDHSARHLRFGGTDEARIAQLYAAASDPDVKVVIALRGGPQRHDLRMRGRIVRADRLVETGRNHLSILDDDRAYRHFSQCPSVMRLIQRPHHEKLVAHQRASSSISAQQFGVSYKVIFFNDKLLP